MRTAGEALCQFINDFSRFENVFSSGTINGQQLYQNGSKAFTDYAPVDFSSKDGLYRTRQWGDNLELFFLDERHSARPRRRQTVFATTR